NSLSSYWKEQGKTPLAMVITYGCQQNENDSERIRGMLSQMGYGFTEDKEKADLILFNTCAVREGAEQRVLGNVGALKHLKKRNPELIVGICGCMMQQQQVAEQIKSKYRHVSLVFGTHVVHRLPELLSETVMKKRRVFCTDDSEGVIAEDIPILREADCKAWVSVMYGCNNFCTYCIVPYVRGRERSRKPEKILAEIKMLAERGVKEITLLGQNVNSYGKDADFGMDFADLLREVNKIDGIFRIRFMTSHPKDMSDRLIDAMAECDKVMPQLHLPFQAGSTRVLSEMNRKYTKEQYLALVEKVRAKLGAISMTSDIIVGFPGETEEDFQETLDVLEKVRFDSVFSFIYSKRTGTPAATMDNQVPEEVQHERFERLLELQNRISREINEEYFEKTVELLVEGASKTDSGVLSGRTPEGKIVNFPDDGETKTGDLITVKITKVSTWSLAGEKIG
ncbi:MAG: tRNA (N6-isopentenyl adenosine(37)-C2)-methylthiotransferase MiaB, partial [Clostridia bacterium]|nr:tRNA (N6-isopentenyl adenosine(37)-C2)-methylthiotransferase MiaB [Clostridia bacterium]